MRSYLSIQQRALMFLLKCKVKTIHNIAPHSVEISGFYVKLILENLDVLK